jgi:dTDP-4-dehydrorhamnose 3,5-epimerase
MGWPLRRAHSRTYGLSVIFLPTALPGTFILELERRDDDRGFFARTRCHREFEEMGLNPDLVQCGVSYNLRRIPISWHW